MEKKINNEIHNKNPCSTSQENALRVHFSQECISLLRRSETKDAAQKPSGHPLALLCRERGIRQMEEPLVRRVAISTH